jgi:hypothetical protein
MARIWTRRGGIASSDISGSAELIGGDIQSERAHV